MDIFSILEKCCNKPAGIGGEKWPYCRWKKPQAGFAENKVCKEYRGSTEPFGSKKEILDGEGEIAAGVGMFKSLQVEERGKKRESAFGCAPKAEGRWMAF